MSKSRYVVRFNEVGKDDIPQVGGKGANLGEMVGAGFPVPDGFIVTSDAYYEFLKENNLTTKIKHLLSTANFQHTESLVQVSTHIKKLIIQSRMSHEIVLEIFKAYKKMGGLLSGDALVAVRSSATAEDLPNASFAGQQETYLNVKGEANVVLKVKEAWASLFNTRAIFYRHEQHFDDFKIGIAVPVQKMVQSEKSGIMFTVDPVGNYKTKIVIEAIFGLGELIVQGAITPDYYEVSKESLRILQKTVSAQSIMLKKVGTTNKEVALSKSEGEKQKLTDDQITKLADLGRKLEQHYYFPQDIEWAVEKNKIYIVQTRPITTIQTEEKHEKAKETREFFSDELLVKGVSASPGIATGPVKIIFSPSEINKVLKGDVLVTPQTNPDFVPAMRKAVAIVTDMGGRTSHAAIVSRELGIPAVVGAQKATSALQNGTIVTVNGTKGEIYKGGIVSSSSSSVAPIHTTSIKTATHVYTNLAEPAIAHKTSLLNVDGVGLLRAEFMMAQIGVHPKKMIKDGRKAEFTKKLVEGLEIFCKSFSPRPVVYRASDFKTNEYRNLTGGEEFEPQEPNPMLGFRGAYRYISDAEVFNLELEAIKIVRNKLGFTNLWMMIPFVRTVSELSKVKKIITDAGLKRSHAFKLWMMVEIPSNVILLDKFIDAGIDGVSIGSNDLTMLILGTDRDNSEVAQEFDERDEAVLWALERVVTTAKKRGITSSICGQAVSVYPSLVEKLVGWGITSVSVAPDALDHTRKIVAHVEKKLIK